MASQPSSSTTCYTLCMGDVTIDWGELSDTVKKLKTINVDEWHAQKQKQKELIAERELLKSLLEKLELRVEKLEREYKALASGSSDDDTFDPNTGYNKMMVRLSFTGF